MSEGHLGYVSFGSDKHPFLLLHAWHMFKCDTQKKKKSQTVTHKWAPGGLEEVEEMELISEIFEVTEASLGSVQIDKKTQQIMLNMQGIFMESGQT